MRQNRKQSNKRPARKGVAGFTLFYAILVIALVAVILSHTLSIALRELRLATTSRESLLAYYAAESASECALYWTLTSIADPSAVRTIQCNGQSFQIGGPSETYTFSVTYTQPAGGTYCADVTINRTRKTIRARGYNTCNAAITRVERGVEATY